MTIISKGLEQSICGLFKRDTTLSLHIHFIHFMQITQKWCVIPDNLEKDNMQKENWKGFKLWIILND